MSKNDPPNGTLQPATACAQFTKSFLGYLMAVGSGIVISLTWMGIGGLVVTCTISGVGRALRGLFGDQPVFTWRQHEVMAFRGFSS